MFCDSFFHLVNIWGKNPEPTADRDCGRWWLLHPWESAEKFYQARFKRWVPRTSILEVRLAGTRRPAWLALLMSTRAGCGSSERSGCSVRERYHYPALKSAHSLNQISCPSGLTETETIMEETLGIPTKHLQWAAVQVSALNFRFVSLGPGSREAAVGQSFSQAH